MTAPARSRGLALVACACCGPAGAGRTNRGRGLCAPCYDRAHRAGTLERWPRRTRTGPDLVADALELRRRGGRAGWSSVGNRAGRPADHGITWAEVARQLGVKPRALEKARQRAGFPDVA